MPDDVHLIVVDSSSNSTPSLVEQSRSGPLTVIRANANISTARQIGSDAANTRRVVFTDAHAALVAITTGSPGEDDVPSLCDEAQRS